MRLINKDTDYAVKALLYVARQDKKRVSASELARDLKIPYPFLRRILQILNAKRIVKSVKGKGGGFILARPPERIYLMDLIKALQGPVRLAECVLNPNACAGVRTCPLRKRILKLQKSFVAEIKSITLASLAEESSSRKR
jgi:Rrf2 family cysteine metabolism transcriptional repressor